jgi:cytochrome b561
MMPAQQPAIRYGGAAIAFHWVMFLFVIAVGILGLLHDSWPKQTQAFWINVHALLGLLLWLLLIARFWWRVKHPPPTLSADFNALTRHLSRTVHWLLYLALFVTPLVGIVTFIWHGRTFSFGPLQLHSPVPADRAIFEPTEDIHGYLAYGIFALVGVHAGAALWHHFVKHDGVLQRMWPFSERFSRDPPGSKD